VCQPDEEEIALLPRGEIVVADEIRPAEHGAELQRRLDEGDGEEAVAAVSGFDRRA
jgi:hypothetical protein